MSTLNERNRAVVRGNSGNRGQLGAAEDAFMRAEFETSRSLATSVAGGSKAETADGALLGARASVALGDAASAFAHTTAALRDFGSGVPRAHAFAVRALAATRLGKAREARTAIDDASKEIARLAPISVGAVKLLLAQEAAERGDVVRTESLLRENVSAGAHEAASLTQLAWLDIERERFADAGVQFSAALRKFSAEGELDVVSHAAIIHGLALVAAETIDLKLADRVRKMFAKAPWPVALRDDLLGTLHYLRYVSLFENDLAGAYFEAREAAVLARTSSQRILADVDAATTSALLGDSRAEKFQFSRAWQTIRSEHWEDGDPGARPALIAFASEAAASMPAEARKAMAMYRNLGAKTSSTSLGGRLPLLMEATAAARIAESGGDEVAAERLYEKALQLARQSHLPMRAAVVALDLRRITGDDAYAQPVEVALGRAPKAWFGAQLAAQDGPIELLSPAELVVLAHILRGETAKSIGKSLGRSPFTISNHTRKIFAAFEVNSRSKVIAMCAEAGVTPEHIERRVR